MPVVTIGDNTADDFVGCEDARIKEQRVTNNYGGASSFLISNYGTGDNHYGLLSFSGLSNIPGPVTVNSLSIYLYLEYVAGTDTFTLNLYRLLRGWVEGTHDNADRSNDTPYSCCWNEYGDGNAWGTAGATGAGDRSTTLSASLVTGTGVGWDQISGAQLLSDYEDRINGTLANYGEHLSRSEIEPYDIRRYTSSEGTDGYRPYLYVDYTASGGGSTYDMSVSESSAISDTEGSTAVLGGSVSEAVSISDTGSSAAIIAGAVSEIISISDSALSVLSFVCSVNESTSVSDDVAALCSFLSSISEATTLSDVLSTVGTFASSVSEGVTVSDLFSIPAEYSESISEVITIIETLSSALQQILNIPYSNQIIRNGTVSASGNDRTDGTSNHPFSKSEDFSESTTSNIPYKRS